MGVSSDVLPPLSKLASHPLQDPGSQSQQGSVLPGHPSQEEGECRQAGLWSSETL